MLDALALAALIGECAPGQAAAPLVAIVREASGFEPLVLSTMQNGRPLSVQAFSKDEAVALAMEMRVAFEPCTNLRVAARLLKEDPGALRPLGRNGAPSPPPAPASAHVAPPTAPGSAPPDPEPIRDQPPVTRAWDV